MVIAEDEAIIRLDLKEILLSAGYDVVGETGRGDEAVTLVEQHQPDLAILDIKMPGMDGVRAAHEITTNHKVAVLVLTAFSQRDLIEDARDAGVAAYLVKPFRRRSCCRPSTRCCRGAGRSGRSRTRSPRSPVDGGDREQAEDKIATRRVVDEAKGVLMDRHGLSRAGRVLRSSSARPCRRGRGCARSPSGSSTASWPREVTPARTAETGAAGTGASGESSGGPLFLLDGMSLAFRAYFALPPDLVTSTGVVTNAVHGFVSMLVYLVREHRPGSLAVAFDPPGGDLP